MAKEFIDFKQQYEDLMKWSTKQIGRVLQDNEDFDPDELYGIGTVAMKKAIDLSNAAMDLVEYQTNCLETIKLKVAGAQGAHEAMANYLTHLDTKLDGLDSKLDKIEEKVKIGINSVYGAKEKKDK